MVKMVNPFTTVWEFFQYLLGRQKRQLFLAAPPSVVSNATPTPTFMSRLWSYLPFVAKPAPPSKRNARLDNLHPNDIRRRFQIRDDSPRREVPAEILLGVPVPHDVEVPVAPVVEIAPVVEVPVAPVVVAPVVELAPVVVAPVVVAPVVELAPVVVAPVVELAPVVVSPVVELAPVVEVQVAPVLIAPVRRHKRRTGPKITTLEPVYGPEPEPASAPAPIVPTYTAVEQTSEVHGPIIPAPCKFGHFCKREDCWFTHPVKKPCNYGENCRNERCTFAHLPTTVAEIPRYIVDDDAVTVFRGPKKAPVKKQRPAQVPMVAPMVAPMTLPNNGMSWADTM